MKKIFVNVWGCRCFVDLSEIEDDLRSEQVDELKFSYSSYYKTFEKANKNCDKSCDGGTEMTVGIEILYIHTNTVHPCVDIALTNPGWKKEYQERRIIRCLNKSFLEKVIDYKIRKES